MHGGRRAYNHLLCLAQSNGIPAGRVDEVLRIVGLESVARRRAGGFSLGMGQRLGIAAALLGDPAVLLFDEPVNGLDPEGIVWVRTLMRALAGEGRTVFVSSHLMSEMALTADHLIVIGRGRLSATKGSTSSSSPARSTPSGSARPALDVLVPLLQQAGGKVQGAPEGAVEVSGLEAVGDRRGRRGQRGRAARAEPQQPIARGGVHGADPGQRRVPVRGGGPMTWAPDPASAAGPTSTRARPSGGPAATATDPVRRLPASPGPGTGRRRSPTSSARSGPSSAPSGPPTGRCSSPPCSASGSAP